MSADKKVERLREALLAMDAGVSQGWILEQRVIWFLIGAGGKAKRDQLIKHFEEQDMLTYLISSLAGVGVIEEENETIILLDDEPRRLDYF